MPARSCSFTTTTWRRSPGLGVELADLAALERWRGAARERPPRLGRGGDPALHVGHVGPAQGRDPDREQRIFRLHQFRARQRVGRNSIFLCDMPLFHTAGLFAASRVPLLGGGSVLISKGFDAETDAGAARRSGARHHPLFLGAANGAAPVAGAGLRSGEAAPARILGHRRRAQSGRADRALHPRRHQHVERIRHVRDRLQLRRADGRSRAGHRQGRQLRPALCLRRNQDRGRGRQCAAGRRDRRAVARRAERDARLLEPAGGE